MLRTHPAYIVAALIALAYVWLVWAHPYLVMQDLSGWVEVAFLHAQVSQGVDDYPVHYAIRAQPWPNSLGVMLASWLGRATDFVSATRVVLSLYVVAFAIASVGLAAVLGRSPWQGLLLLPAALDHSWAYGFLNFLVAKPIALATLACAVRFAERPTRGRGALMVTALACTFLGHAMVWGVTLLGCALSVGMLAPGRWRWLGQLPVLASTLIAVPYVWVQLEGPAGPDELVWFTPSSALPQLWFHLGDLSPAWGEEIAFASVSLLALMGWSVDRLQRGPVPWDPRTRLLGVAALCLLLVVLFGPRHLPNVSVISQRLVSLLWMLALLLPRLSVQGARRFMLVGVTALAVLAQVHGVGRSYDHFERHDMRGFAELVRSIPPRTTLATDMVRSRAKAGFLFSMWHWPKLHTVWNQGRTSDSFTFRSTTYVTLTQAARDAGFARKPAKNEQGLSAWDYLLVHGAGPRWPHRDADWLRLRGKAAGWELFAIEPR